MATLRPPAPAVGSWEEPPPPPPRAAAPPPDDDGHNHHPKPPSSSTPSGARAPPPPPQQTTPKQTSVDDAAAELMSYLDSTSSALSASARAAEGEASEARQNALAALRIAQNYSSPSPRSFSGGAAAPPPPVLSVPPPPSSSSSPGGKKRKNPLLAAAAGVGAQVGVPAPTGAGPIAANFPPPPPSSLAAGTAGHPTSYSAPVTPATSGAATPGTATSTSRLAQSHAEDVLSLALEVETLRSQLEAERQSHSRTRSLLASEKSRSAELEGDLRFTKTELESTVERHRRESDRRTRESERAAARVAAAEEDAALALDLARAASDGRDQMEGWLGAAMAEIERLKGGGGGGGGDDGDGGAEGQSPEEAARQVRHEIEDEDGGGHQHERGAHPHNPGELLKRDSSIFHHRHDSTSPERHQPRNDAGGPPSAEPAIFDPANASASASAAGGGAIPEHASFDPLAPDDDGDEGEEDMSSSYGAGYDAPTDASLAGDAGDDADADASLTTVGTNPSLGTPGGGGFAFGRAYVFATDDGGEGEDEDGEEVEDGVEVGGGGNTEVEDDDIDNGGGGDPPASFAAAAAAATPPTGNNSQRRSGASRAMVAVGRDLLLRRTGATASGNAAGDPASRSPSSAAYRVSLARIAERRTRLHERLNRGAGADVELDGGRGDRASPSGMRDNSPRGEHVPQRGVNLGRHRIYLTSASADKVLELLRDSGRRLRLGRNFVLTDGDNLGGMDGLGGVRGGGMDGIGAGGDGGGSGSPGGDGGADEEDERMETGRSTLSNIEGIAANYCRAVEAKVNLQKEECRQLESLCEYLEGRVVESDFGQDLA